MVKIYRNDEVFPIGTTFESKKDPLGKIIRKYEIVEIYRTYNSSKQLVMIRYDAKNHEKKEGIYGIKHDDLKSHFKAISKEKYKKT